MAHLSAQEVYQSYKPTKILLKHLDTFMSLMAVSEYLNKTKTLLNYFQKIKSKPHQTLLKELSDQYAQNAANLFAISNSLSEFYFFYQKTKIKGKNPNFENTNYYTFIIEYCAYWKFDLNYINAGGNLQW